ncbi:cell division protein FtsQ/DivIB [Actinomyces sp. MRS3W]|uniref:cell division protein FtsQ/DivIB n=1 Tax=Actinomyces sp. MRS3W TaxID=2800796 RepID=UPI0028FD1C73|nr:FtsQ-type POTRA domain-containing protein [Actinomyces sp. MRS3W]MDU0347887.1 FtsQ-type POTRA domain-containing protein [Actinomyces sp. MRS3W]
MRKPSPPRPRHTGEPENEDYATVPDAERPTTRDEDETATAASPHAGAVITEFEYEPATGALPARAGHRDRVVSTGLTDRLDERRRARRRLRRGRLLALTGAVGAVILLVWAALFSPLLELRTADITISGSDGTVDAQAVQETLADHAGQSLLRLDVAALGDEVADSLIRVQSAAVTRSWPHGLAVTLTMRVPVAVRQVTDGYEVLDGEAVVLETRTQAPEGLAVIKAESGQELSEAQVSALTEAIGSLDADVRAQVSEGSVSGTGQVTLTLASGATVVWGDATDSALKAEVLKVLLGQEAQTYDVSSPHAPTTS